VDQGKGSARSLRLAGLTCHWLYISGFSPTPLVCLMPGKFGLRGRIARIRSGTLWLETVSEEPSIHGPHPAQARPAQILKRNQEEASADRALLLAAAENGWMISIMLEECALPYNVIPINLSKGEQFKPEQSGTQHGSFLSARRGAAASWSIRGQDINQFPRLKRWLERVLARPARRSRDTYSDRRGVTSDRRGAQPNAIGGEVAATMVPPPDLNRGRIKI